MDKLRLGKDDYNGYAKLFVYSFGITPEKDDETALKEMYQNSIVYGTRKNNTLMTSIMCISFTTNFFGQTFKVTSLANVMSAPENHQKDGIDNQSLQDMYKDDIALSYLDPFARLSKHPEPNSGHIERYKFPEATELIADIFACHNTYGGIQEADWWWDLLKLRYPDYFVAVYRDDSNEIRGYLIYSFAKDEFIVRDLVYETPDSFLSIMKFIYQHSSSYKQLTINSDDSSLRPDLFVSEPIDAKTSIEPFMMVRIVNLQKFMQSYPTQISNLSKIRIKVKDSLFWNNYVCSLEIKSGKVTFEQDDNAIYDLTVDIQTLTKALFGYRSLRDSYMIGQVHGDMEKVVELDEIFIKEHARLNGEF